MPVPCGQRRGPRTLIVTVVERSSATPPEVVVEKIGGKTSSPFAGICTKQLLNIRKGFLIKKYITI